MTCSDHLVVLESLEVLGRQALPQEIRKSLIWLRIAVIRDCCCIDCCIDLGRCSKFPWNKARNDNLNLSYPWVLGTWGHCSDIMALWRKLCSPYLWRWTGSRSIGIPKHLSRLWIWYNSFLFHIPVHSEHRREWLSMKTRWNRWVPS